MAGEVLDDSVEHTAQFYTGALPAAASGTIAAVVHDYMEDTNRQQAQAGNFYSYLQAEDDDYEELNLEKHIQCALIAVPQSNMVLLTYSWGGATDSDKGTPIEDKLLCLTGEGGGDLGPPQPLMLPTSMFESRKVCVMTHAQFSATLSAKGKEFAYPLLKRSAVDTQDYVYGVCPIPPYLVYDGFSKDLHAVEVYERILSLSNQVEP